jgi:hypothetical protein
VATISFEGLTLGAGGSLHDDLGRLLRGSGFPHRGQDRFVHEWLARAWTAQEPDERALLAAGVAAHLTDHDVRVRSEAIRFFQTQRAADDVGALHGALHSAPELFDAVVDPLPGAPSDLRMELARAVAIAPDRLGAPGALRPGMAGGVVAGLFYGDKVWVLENAREIIRRTPGAYTTLLLNLALHEQELGSFVISMRDIFPDEAAEAIVRERFASRPAQLDACLRALDLEPTVR